MAKINLDLLREVYLCDHDTSSISELIEEALISIESTAEYMSYDELYGHSRSLALAYIALSEANKEIK